MNLILHPGQRVRISASDTREQATGITMSLQQTLPNGVTGSYVLVDGVVPPSYDIEYPGCYMIARDRLTPIEGTDPLANIIRYDETVFNLQLT